MYAGGGKCIPCEDAGVFRFFLLHNQAHSERRSCLGVFYQLSPVLNRKAADKVWGWGGSRGLLAPHPGEGPESGGDGEKWSVESSGPASDRSGITAPPWGEGAALGEPRGGPLALRWAARWGGFTVRVSGPGWCQEGSLLCVWPLSPGHTLV